MDLEEWHGYVEAHFSTLSNQRDSTGLPIFAFEHGLSKAELNEIFDGLHEQLTEGYPSRRYWLLWTIYAAEQGYSYEGGEYWHSFEKSTPNWDSRYRYTLATWFHKFCKEFNGYIPSGTWAEHFSIIAWPITHAILPKYLQHQFARTIYRLRFRLSRISSLEPAVIGRLIAANSYDSTTRFEQFLQQEELVGRIVLGLLHTEPKEGEEPILNATLERIVKDLELVRNAKTWLKETSRIVTDRFQGLSTAGVNTLTERRNSENKIRVRPRLYLRLSSNNSFSVLMEIPSFRSVAELNSDIQEFLKTTRCLLNGERTKRPSGWILSSKPKAILKYWPEPNKPLISFERENGFLENLLRTDCVLGDGPVWVFRISPDGLAIEIVSKIIRPEYSYIFVSRQEFSSLLSNMVNCEMDCENLHAIRVNAINDASKDYLKWLSKHGLNFAKTIKLWPAGLYCRNWDGEGHSEWLSTEKPCIGILADHPVHSYTLTLDNDSGTIINAHEDGTPNFIQLPNLNPGVHSLKVKSSKLSRDDFSDVGEYLEGYLELQVREPEPWISGTTSHSGLAVLTDPYDPSLDKFWENEVELTVHGPENRHVIPEVALEDSEGNQFYSARVCENIPLPITPDLWERKFKDFLSKEKADWRYLSAYSGVLKLHGQELGEYVVRFDYAPMPVRWVLEHDSGEIIIRLIDDTGKEEHNLDCYFYSFEKPIEKHRIDYLEAQVGIKVQCPGGLYLVEGNDPLHKDTVIVSSGLTEEGLTGLGVQPHYGRPPVNSYTIYGLLQILSNWRHARLAGFLANARRHNVVQGLLNVIYGQIVGWPWVHIEKFCSTDENIEKNLDSLERAIEMKGGFCVLLRRDALKIMPEYEAISAWFFETASRYGHCDDKVFTNFLIDLVGRPQELISIYGDDLPAMIKEALKKPILVKCARFIALSWVFNTNEYSDMLPRWKDDKRD